MTGPRELSQAGKEELALALILWRSFKADHKMDIQVFTQALQFAEHLGVKQQYEDLDKKLIFPFDIKMGGEPR